MFLCESRPHPANRPLELELGDGLQWVDTGIWPALEEAAQDADGLSDR